MRRPGFLGGGSRTSFAFAFAFAFAFSFASACAGLKSAPDPDAGSTDALDGSTDDPSQTGDDAGGPDGARDARADAGAGADGAIPKGDAGVGPSSACRAIPIDCLDLTSANVIEVPTETTLADAFTNAKAGDVVQVRGKTLGAGWKIPAYVTLRGCQGAAITGTVSFVGSGGILEGFEVSSSVVANQTGSYVVRFNRFTTDSVANQAGVSGRSIDALVSASVALVVESNRFENREVGVEARTSYDTLTHAVDITLRNNVFSHVAKPFVASESGLVGVINARVEHNTFYAFDTAIALYGMDRKSTTSGNLFAEGTKGIEGSPYDLFYSFAWHVTTPAATAPLTGAFATGDPMFVDPDAGDLRLGPSSSVVDRIPNGTAVPNEDYQGCPRPAGAPGAQAQSDVGAYESQP